MQKNRQCRREWGFAMDFAAADSALPENKGLRQKYTLPAAHKVFSSAAGLLVNVTRAGLTAARQILHNRFTIKKIAANACVHCAAALFH